MGLRELTKENHQRAERQKFVGILLSGKIDPKLYAQYLWNQYFVYKALEEAATAAGLFADLPNIERHKLILEDFQELWADPNNPILCASTNNYIEHIKNIKNDNDKLMAHLYVRHMGDLSGGQMIARCVPGSKRYYKFDLDVNECKEKIRARTNNGMADEAKICFDYATELFQELV
jgi:heme oxygenase